MLSDIQRPVSASVVKSIWRSVLAGSSGGGSGIIADFDYLVVLGSSTMEQALVINPILGNQQQNVRKAVTGAGHDIPVINKATGGATIANLDTNVNTYLTALGPISAADPSSVAVLIVIGSNDIGIDDYDSVPQVTRDAMVAGMNSIVDKVLAFGFTPIIGSSNSRKNLELLYEEWAEKFYDPLTLARTPLWYDGGTSVFDYSKLYLDNKDVPDWWNPDNTHPWMATPVIHSYTVSKLASKANLPVLPLAHRILFYHTPNAQTNGGFNTATSGVSGTVNTLYDSNGNLVSGATFGWTGATGASGGVRAIPGNWNIDLSNSLAHVSSTYAGAGITITYTATFGAAYANRTGTLRCSSNTSAASRLTKFTVGANSVVVNGSAAGVQIGEVPFTFNASGTLVITVTAQSPATIANVSGFDFVFN